LFPFAGPRAAGTQDAGSFLSGLNERAIQQLVEPGIEQEEQERRFRILLEEYFSIPTIGRFVLGRYRRVASAEEKRAFLSVFEDVIVKRYLPLFVEISTATLDIGPVRANRNNPRFVSVASQIRGLKREPVSVEWRIRIINGKYKIVDIVAEGVSLAMTLRSAYGAFISRHGGDVRALITNLQNELVTSNFALKKAEFGTVR
jgi:phospholipid transport system substrate-binding protein